MNRIEYRENHNKTHDIMWKWSMLFTFLFSFLIAAQKGQRAKWPRKGKRIIGDEELAVRALVMVIS